MCCKRHFNRQLQHKYKKQKVYVCVYSVIVGLITNPCSLKILGIFSTLVLSRTLFSLFWKSVNFLLLKTVINQFTFFWGRSLDKSKYHLCKEVWFYIIILISVINMQKCLWLLLNSFDFPIFIVMEILELMETWLLLCPNIFANNFSFTEMGHSHSYLYQIVNSVLILLLWPEFCQGAAAASKNYEV